MARLERLLKEVKAFKERNYVGSMEALEIVRGILMVDEMPGLIARKINRDVKRKFGKVSYKATGARVIGLHSLLKEQGKYAAEKADTGDPQADMFNVVKFNRDVLEIREQSHPWIDILYAEYFMPYFMSANLANARTNVDFKRTTIGLLFAAAYNWRQRLSDTEERGEYMDDYITFFMQGLQSAHWRDHLSIEGVGQRKEAIKDMVYASIDHEGIALRVVREDLAHDSEYRQMAIRAYLASDDFEDAAEAIAAKKNILSNSKHRMRKLVKMKAPSEYLDAESRKRMAAKLLISIMAVERKYVAQYIHK